MTDPVKKTTKKAKTTATKEKPPAKSTRKAPTANGRSNVTEIGVSHEQIALLAHEYWIKRGFAHGYDADDWFRAEQELRGKAS